MMLASRGMQNWRTPLWLFKPLNRIFRFTVDAASDGTDNLLPRYWDMAECEDWEGERVFCNPPFKQAAQFVLRARLAKLAIVVLLANMFSTKYYHKWPADFLFIPSRRIKYVHPEGKESNAEFSSGLACYGVTDEQMKAVERAVGGIALKRF